MDERNYLFRGDDHYAGGPIGLPLGEVADGADIQNPAEHVLRKTTRKTSRYASFTLEVKIARRFTTVEEYRNVRKVKLSALRELESRGLVRLWEPDQVHDFLINGPKKSAKQAGDVRNAMRRNCELLIEGQIPADFIEQVV